MHVFVRRRPYHTDGQSREFLIDGNVYVFLEVVDKGGQQFKDHMASHYNNGWFRRSFRTRFSAIEADVSFGATSDI